MKNDEILNLALDHGLRLKDEALSLNEMNRPQSWLCCDLHEQWVANSRREDRPDQIQHENILIW